MGPFRAALDVRSGCRIPGFAIYERVAREIGRDPVAGSFSPLPVEVDPGNAAIFSGLLASFPLFSSLSVPGEPQ